jgi:hypothetical protein
MVLGFTGTRHGMSALQVEAFAKLVTKLNQEHEIEVFNHGDCLGADAEAHDWISQHLPRCAVYIYPSRHTYLRAYRSGTFIDLPAAPMDRNRRIVDRCDFMIATPNTRYEILRSGTWATIRYARRVNKTLRILLP